MITPTDMEKFSNNEVVIMYQKLNEKLSKTIIQKLTQNGDILSFTKAQIRTLQLQGGKDIFKQALKETNGLTKQRKEEINNLFDEIAEKEMKGYSEVYKQKDLNYKLSTESVQLLKKVKRITNNEMKNFTRSVAYASQSTYINAVDDLYKQVVSGAFDYDSAMKKTITELAEKGVTLTTKDGRNEKIEVAVKRNLMTSIKQTANSIAKDVGDIIGANCVVIGHSDKCRPTHHVIDSVIMSLPRFKQLEYLTEEPNCYHLVNYDWRPEFENTKSKVVYDDEHESYADTVKNYNIQQKARYYERQVRQAKRVIASGVDSKEARINLRNAQARLRVYNKTNGLEQDYSRTWTPRLQ
jgi:hypothetical protein